MDDAEERQLRDRMHELADKLNTLVTRAEVVSVRLDNATMELGRINQSVIQVITKSDDHANRLAVLETRDADARAVGGRWGAVGGGLIAGLLYALQHLFAGPPKP